MRRPSAAVLPSLLLLAACGGGADAGGGAQAVTRDSAGIAIVEYPAGAWDAAPTWSLSAEPLAVLGAEEAEGSLDLTNSSVGTLLDDGRLIAATMQPPQVYVFSPTGEQQGTIGRGGEGPGEYRFLSAIFPLGGDSIVAYDMFTRHALLYRPDGEAIGQIEFPVTGTPVPPMLSGRLDDGTWVFQVINPLIEPPADAGDVYRLDQPVLLWRTGMTGFDTIFTMPGQESNRGTFDAPGGQSIPISRGVGYGANSWLGVRGNTIWTTPGDRFLLQARDGTGAITREVRFDRPVRPVTEEAKERFREVAREQIERMRAMVPPGMLDSELEKINTTPFAANYPQIGQMVVDRLGRVWATPDLPLLDSTLTWTVFSNEGQLLGRVALPKGMLFAASADRVVVRGEDDATGLVTLQVYGLNTVCEEC